MDTYIYTHTQIHTYGPLTTIHMYTPTCTYIHTYIYSHLPTCPHVCTYIEPSLYTNVNSVILVCHKSNLKNMVGTIILVLGLDMTSQLIRLGLSNHPSTLIRAKMKCCKTYDHISYPVTNCLATRIPFWSITGHLLNQ